MKYLFRLTLDGEDSIRGTDALVERLRQLRRTGSVADVSVHVYDGSLKPENHLGAVPGTRVLMARTFDPAWVKE